MSVVESVLWRCLRWPGHEATRLIALHHGTWMLEGAAAFAQDGQPCAFTYAIACDETWATKQAHVEGSIGQQLIDCNIEVGEVWRLNGVLCPEVNGCVDIDLNFSPSTNLLPIRRLDLAIGASARVDAAWLRFPSFTFAKLDQEYTRVGKETYTYRNLASGFVAELQVSANGMVLNYGEIWTAETAAQS